MTAAGKKKKSVATAVFHGELSEADKSEFWAEEHQTFLVSLTVRHLEIS